MSDSLSHHATSVIEAFLLNIVHESYALYKIMQCDLLFFFNASLIPRVKFRPAYLGKTTAATRAALPTGTGMCSIFVCPNNGIATSCLGFVMYTPILTSLTPCYQCLNSVAMPSYLCELLQTYRPTRTLRSQDSSRLVLPRFSLNIYG